MSKIDEHIDLNMESDTESKSRLQLKAYKDPETLLEAIEIGRLRYQDSNGIFGSLDQMIKYEVSAFIWAQFSNEKGLITEPETFKVVAKITTGKTFI